MEISISVGEILSSGSSQYLVLEMMGAGGCGNVFKCKNMKTNDLVVLKLPSSDETIFTSEEEINYLKKVSSLNHPNIIKFLESFDYKGYPCVVLEMLYKDLNDVVDECFTTIDLSKIRAIAKQIFMALDALASVHILHADLKPDNIMLVNENNLEAKLIDFGMAYEDSETEEGMIVQPIPYRAPEVLLGLPFSYGVDLWGMGCSLMFLHLKKLLFSVSSEYEMVYQVIQMLGQPEDDLLSEGLYTRKYFVEVDGPKGTTWRLKTPEEYNLDATEKIEGDIDEPVLASLDDILKNREFSSVAEFMDLLQFLDLVKSLLNTDSAKRISASEALNHPFITMSHLLEPDVEDYLNDSIQMMAMPMMSYCKEVEPVADNDGNKEEHMGDMEREGYECTLPSDGKHHGESPEFEHLEGVHCKPPDGELTSELGLSIWGSPLKNTTICSQPPMVALHTGWAETDTSNKSPNTPEPLTAWETFKTAITCCFGCFA